MKRCSTCKVEKPLTEFYKDKTKKDGLRSQCKSCVKSYYEANKDKLKSYYKANKDKVKSYYEANKDKVKSYYEANKDKVKDYQKANKDNINARRRERRKTDSLYKMKHNLRKRTYEAFSRKGYSKTSKTQEMLGVDWEIAKAHIERQFTKGMNWSNQGEWHIDHIIPLASANTEEELKKLCHYTNLQPLWAEDNLSKSASIDGQQIKFRI